MNIEGRAKVFFGKRKEDNTSIYISKPTWDCGWYWSFGYLGNNNEHYHLSSYQIKNHMFNLENGKFKFIAEQRNKHMYDCLLEDYELSDNIKDNLWVFCELALTIYALKETAEILNRGGYHTTENPCKDVIINPDEVKRINEIVLPVLLNTFWHLVTTGKIKKGE